LIDVDGSLSRSHSGVALKMKGSPVPAPENNLLESTKSGFFSVVQSTETDEKLMKYLVLHEQAG